MSDIVDFSTTPPTYRKSVNTPDFEDNPDILINPKVPDVETKYWKRDGNRVKEMTKTEKTQVDLAEKQERIDAIENYNFDGGQLAEALVNEGLITKTKIVNFIKGKEGLN